MSPCCLHKGSPKAWSFPLQPARPGLAACKACRQGRVEWSSNSQTSRSAHSLAHASWGLWMSHSHDHLCFRGSAERSSSQMAQRWLAPFHFSSVQGVPGVTVLSGRAGQPDPSSDPALRLAAPCPLEWSFLLSRQRQRSTRLAHGCRGWDGPQSAVFMLQTQEGQWGGPARVQTPENRRPPCPSTEEHRSPSPRGDSGSSPFLRLSVLLQPTKCWVMPAHLGMEGRRYWFRGSPVPETPKNDTPGSLGVSQCCWEGPREVHRHTPCFYVVKDGLQSLSRVWLFEAPCAVAPQGSLSIAFPRQKHWFELPFPLRGSSPSRDGACASCVSFIGRWIFPAEPPEKPC